MTRVIFAALLLTMTACGDDATVVDSGTDSGMRDAGTDSTADVSTSDATDAGALVTSTVSATVVDGSDPDRPPLEGVHVVIRTDAGEYEETTGADGRYRIEFEAVPGGNNHFVVAKEGYRIFAVLNPTEAPTDTFEELVLEQLMPEVDLVRVSGTVTGIPEGGRACFSSGRNTACGTEFGGMFPRDGIRDMTSALALNPDETVYDFVVAPIVADGDGFMINVDFDGVMETPPMTRTVTFELPADAESPFRKEPLDPRWVAFLSGFSPDLVRRGFTTGITTADDGATYTGTFSVFPEDGEEIGYTAAFFVGGVYQPGASAGPNAQHFQWYGTTAPETVVIPEAPAIVSGTSLRDPFTVTAPPAEGVRVFGIFTSSGIQAWQAIDFAPSETFQVPGLPSAYDTSVSYPFTDSPGTLRVSHNLGERSEDSRTPATFVRSEAYPITF